MSTSNQNAQTNNRVFHRVPPFVRESQHDRRIRWGDDYAGDAWRDSVGTLFWVVVGHVPINSGDADYRWRSTSDVTNQSN